MIDNITTRPIALKEIEEAWQWYESRREGLGNDFVLCVEESLEKISRNPKLYPTVHKEIRRALIRRFPYGIFYFIEKNKIVVVGVFHGSRNPKHWKNRA
ncbi:MAG: type II toxin-antitoxin system RelE/ParE family toxin [Deltaproteobacteria bacterium]|jgi:plasmid stabilization system protein ParE|nr:type II toxin-antitoxin system RelE/ParE family toxin [Deltaproteobacteria bacterium]